MRSGVDQIAPTQEGQASDYCNTVHVVAWGLQVEEQKARPQRIVQEAESPPPPPSPSPRPPPLEPPSPQFPPEPKAPQPPPRAVAKPAQQKPQQQQADAATQSSSQSVIQPSRPHNQIDDEIDEIEYPKSDEDYERILVRRDLVIRTHTRTHAQNRGATGQRERT